jgi:hypothetical protein
MYALLLRNSFSFRQEELTDSESATPGKHNIHYGEQSVNDPCKPECRRETIHKPDENKKLDNIECPANYKASDIKCISFDIY